MKLFTIGFTQKSAEDFFTCIKEAGVKRIIDVRLNNVSQLAGFAKKTDLRYFAHALCNAEYVHMPELAPTKEMLDSYKKHKGDWATYERLFLELMRARRIEETVPPSVMDGGCLLCSEKKPHNCHRRLVAEYLNGQWGNISIEHLP